MIQLALNSLTLPAVLGTVESRKLHKPGKVKSKKSIV